MLKRFGMVASVLALLVLTLAGCKNGMLGEDEATVNGLRGVGSRMARVTVTNFEDDGRLRTIAADQPDVKAAGQWYFVASGNAGDRVLSPRFIAVDQTTGRVNLADLGAAVWNVTITMFDKAKLDAAIPGVDAAQTTDNAKEALENHRDCIVLTGVGTVDLIRGDSDVRITLTTRGVGGNATVGVTVELHADDKATITQETYQVSYGLYDKVTGVPIQVNAQSSVEVKDHTAAVANYKYQALNQPVEAGEYLFKVIINPTPAAGKGGPWQWSTNIIVEGNLGIDERVQLPAIIGKAPAAPTNFKVYWDSAVATAEEYTVRLSWDRASYNEDYFKLQLVDITGKISDAFDSYSDGTGAVTNEPVTNSQNLWENSITVDPDFVDEAAYTIGKNFQNHTYPIYAKEGSLLAGNTFVEYILETGHVYAVRLCSTNVNGDSAWVYPNAGTDSAEGAVWKGQFPTRSDLTESAINVFSIKYDLSGYALVQANQTLNTNKKTEFKAVAYEVAGATIENLPYHDPDNATGYLLYTEAHVTGNGGNTATKADGANIAWDSWVDKNTGSFFNNQQATYNKYANLVLRPNSITAGSGQVVVDAGGTYKNQLTDSCLFLFQSHNPADTPLWTNNHTLNSIKLQAYTNGAQVGMQKDGNDKIIITLDEAQDDYLYFDVGINSANMGKVMDFNNNEAVLKSVKYSIVDYGGYEFKYVEGKTKASMNMDGLSGDFMMIVEATSGSGINFRLQFPIVVRNKNVPYTP